MLDAEFRVYIEACNRHDWRTVRTYFGVNVVINGQWWSVDDFLDELANAAAAHPQRRWSVLSATRADDTIDACLLREGPGQYGVELVQYRTTGTTITEITFA